MEEAIIDAGHHPPVAPDLPPSGSHENPPGEEGSHQPQQSSFIEAMDPKSSHVDTAVPIDSVKGAVSKFGGILDWREKRVQLQDELDKVQVEVAKYQKGSQEAEAGKARALQELESTASAADELRHGLEKAEAEEAQARQEADLAELQAEEAQARHGRKAELDAARDDLQSARAEVAALETQRAAAAADADAVAARARETAAASREAGKAVEDLAAELVVLKKELESSSAAHAAAEEKRMAVAAAFEEDKSRWQGELEEAEQEARRLREELMAACDLEVKTEAAAQLLASLLLLLEDGNEEDLLEKANKELEDVKQSIAKAKAEAESLRFAAAFLRDTLDREKAGLAALQRKQELSSATIDSLEEELSRAAAELAAAEARAKELHDATETTDEQQASEARREAEQAKAKAWSAREELSKAKEEASAAKVSVAATAARLEAVTQETLAANASAETATASANALLLLQETATSAKEEGVTLTAEEYEELSRRAREMEDAAGKRVVEAVKLIKEAKDAEVRSLEKLKQLARLTEQRRRAVQAATEEAEEAEFAKLSAERELRQWRADHEHQHPRAGLAEISALDYDYLPGSDGRANPHILSPRGGYMLRNEAIVAVAAEAEARQKKAALFPRMVMFLARKRAQK